MLANRVLIFTIPALLICVRLCWGQDYINTNQVIEKYYERTHEPKQNIFERLQAAATFLDGPYRNGPLGEGESGRFDSEPLYRIDVFDCQTFVETSLALALSKDLEGFQRTINQIRYRKGEIGFLKRNHFISLDWNKNNQSQGFIKDITRSIKDNNNESIAELAQTIIDKPSWVRNLNLIDIELANSISWRKRSTRLKELRSLADSLEATPAQIWYLPFKTLFDENKKIKKQFLKQIPAGAIIQIVRPDWNIKHRIGTNLNVSHLGITIESPKGLIFRSASEPYKRVINITLERYLRHSLNDATVKGISVYLPKEQPI